LQTLDRIGSKKPKVFAKFDMTSGYFQMAFDQSIRDATSFIYPAGDENASPRDGRAQERTSNNSSQES
jgi:hypothetical protein